MHRFDIAIIGGGPAGYSAAERAVAKGLRPVLFEKRELGGVCLNEGCIPTKTLLYSAKVFDGALHGDKYGVKSESVSFDYARIVARKNKVVRKLVAGVKAKMHGVEVVVGEATITGRSSEGFQITADGVSHTAPSLLICTGSEAFIPPIEGVSEAISSGCVLTNREILALKERPASLIIVGGGVIGMEFASLFNSLGTEVTVIEQMPEILGQNDLGISEMLRVVYTKKGVRFHLSCKVASITGGITFSPATALAPATAADGSVAVSFVDIDNSEHTLTAEKVLVSVGRRPVVHGFGLETLGVELNECRGIKTDEHMRTNVPGVFAAGDVTGFSMLAHTACREAEVVINNLATERSKHLEGSPVLSNMATDPDTMSYEAVPGVVYTNPEVASAGMTYAAAQAKGLRVRELRLPMAYAGRFVAENEGGEGLCKVVADEQGGRVRGVHMIGNPASEAIWGACVAIEQHMTVSDLQKIIFPHPTVGEIIRETAFTF